MNYEAATAYSGAGLAAGYTLGRYVKIKGWSWLVSLFKKEQPERAAEPYDPKADLPQVIPEVRFSEAGEPIIAREEVHHVSPIPRSLAIVLLLLAALSVAYNAVQQVERNNDNARANRRLQEQVTANKVLLDQQGRQQAVIDANEQRLEDLVLAISTARTPRQVTLAIQRFLKSSAQAHQQEQQNQPNHPATYQSPRPRPTPQQSPQSRGSSSPSPKPSRSSSSSPSPRTAICVQGVGCVTSTPLPTVFRVDSRVHSEPVSTPSTQQSIPWYAFLGVVPLAVGTVYLVYRRHRDPL